MKHGSPVDPKTCLVWKDLDSVLVKRLKLHSNCVRIIWYANGYVECERKYYLTTEDIKAALRHLLPQVMKEVGDGIDNMIEMDYRRNLETWFA